ncbi:uncharacterized protein K460DRAFT_430843 [Cucurbitaria berberidis CBS 394.84]|uniref:Probable double zinc ribbon domain-containing protein n=1 Tax=Cucurbitaria berberidis CBS 394.84 TaxID=1168544 RepID=A0A9P4GGX0_9PLEO|nr:uncharacterized protein K460DRAFT_430843 [Cucurbitaria berberidis CBS 394.84]KAF1845893.1 hypothetical protein K460DRAFT_430843 [Cucurbitaria berberidis CBS 394.84]
MPILKRQGSILRLNRLSVAISTTLTSVIERVQAQKSDHSTSHLTIPVQDHRFSGDSSLSSIRALRTDAEIGDGLWICCHCRHENILRHYKGRFPFQYLRCDRCNRTLCPECHASEILSPLPYGMICAPRPAGGRDVRYCHVCSACGLSHRAEMGEGAVLDFYGVTCAGCGTSSYGDWPRYHIGNNEPYRRDPDATFAKLVDQKADDAARVAFHWVIANPESESNSAF